MDLPDVITEAGFTQATPALSPGALILDDLTAGLLDTGTLADATGWTSLGGYINGLAIIQGLTVTRQATRQQGPLVTYQGGTLTVTLNNSDARFSPENLAGPYVTGGESQVRPMIPVRARARWAGVDYPLFGGYASSWTPPTANLGPDYDRTVLEAADAFKVLTGSRCAAAAAQGGGELAGARITRILAAAGWYAAPRGMSVISAGSSPLQATTLGDYALNLAQLTADSEIGELYADGAGRVVFRGRRDLLTDPRSVMVQAIFGDNPGTVHVLPGGWSFACNGTPVDHTYFIATNAQAALIRAGQQVTDTANAGTLFTVQHIGDPFAGYNNITITPAAAVIMDSTDTVTQAAAELAYHEIARPDDDATLANDVQAQIDGSSNLQQATDTASVAKYLFPRSYSRTDLILDSDAAARDWAGYVLYIAKTDESRFDQMQVLAHADPDDLYPQVLGRELGDRIQVWRRPPGQDPVVKDCFIRGIRHEVSLDGGWVTTWDLQAAARYSFLVLDDPGLGKLNSNALAF